MGGGDTGSKTAKSEPNVVPLCDILLVLLIIFMVVTPMIKKGANVSLPEASHTQDQPESSTMITVHVQEDGTVYLNDEIVDSLESLVQQIEDKMEETKQVDNKVLLRADNKVAYGKVTQVMDLIRRAQIEVVGLVTQAVTSSE
jgi:biopolymer transport protein TolR